MPVYYINIFQYDFLSRNGLGQLFRILFKHVNMNHKIFIQKEAMFLNVFLFSLETIQYNDTINFH